MKVILAVLSACIIFFGGIGVGKASDDRILSDPLNSFQLTPFTLNLNRTDALFTANNFQDFLRLDLFSPLENDDLKNNRPYQEGFQLEFRRFKFSLSRYVLNLDQNHSLRLSDLERQKQDLIKSLPSTIQTGSLQDRMETVGRIIEPSFNLKIEF